MTAVQYVSPRPALRVDEDEARTEQAIFAVDPLVVLGNDRVPPLIQSPVTPDAASCFGPRDAALGTPDGPLLVCDTGHHRLLGWKTLPVEDRVPADWQIGQYGFGMEGRNGRSEVGPATLNVPTGVCFAGSSLVVGDAWNHRVLIWHNVPDGDNQPADVVLGQRDFQANEPNRGREEAGAETLNWPYGVHFDGHRLYVSDSGNRRVLVWNGLPTQNGAPADLVLGQRDFAHKDENAGGEPHSASMRWPHSLATWRDRLCVADAGNNRIMIWSGPPERNGVSCDTILGQTSPHEVDHNRSLYWPRAGTLNMPYGIAAAGDWLLVADTANSRVLGWHVDDLVDGGPARALFGQRRFTDKGDNRWQAPVADSLCWPYGINACGDFVVVADSGNNRVSVWKVAT